MATESLGANPRQDLLDDSWEELNWDELFEAYELSRDDRILATLIERVTNNNELLEVYAVIPDDSPLKPKLRAKLLLIP